MAVPLCVAAVGVLVVSTGGVASAAPAPQPSLAQAQAQLNTLNSKAQVLDQQFDAAQQQLDSANAQLALINGEIARDKVRYEGERRQIAQIATEDYEDGDLNAPQVLLTSTNPQRILNQASILLELSSANNDQLATFISTTKQLVGAQAAAKRVSEGKQAIVNNLASQKAANAKLIAQENALIAELTPAQQTTVAADGLGGGAVTTLDIAPATNAQAQAAVNFAAQAVEDDCPYVFGGTGPCADGYDCSGLMQAAWAAAGVSIPRTSEEQAALPAVAEADMQPGDIMEFDGDGHVGMYVGNGMLIDAPHAGLDVEEVAFSGWYADNFDGAVRP